MGRDSAPLINTQHCEVTEFVSEFARYLLAAGIGISQFTAIARYAFFKAAAIDAKFGNRRLNQSAVAAMTGLTRLQVRHFARRNKMASLGRRDRIRRVIEGWTTDPAYLTTSYAPRRLSLGSDGTFAALVRKYGGDVPTKSVLREMIRIHAVTVTGQLVRLQSKMRRTVAQRRLYCLSRSLAELLKEAGERPEAVNPLRILGCETTYPATSRKGRILLQKRLVTSLNSLMGDLKAAGSAASLEAPPSPKQKSWQTRTRFVVITEELRATRGDKSRV